MSKKKKIFFFDRSFWRYVHATGNKSFSLKRRLFLFLSSLCVFIVLFILGIFFVSGALNSKNDEMDAYLMIQSDYLHQNLDSEFGKISLQSIFLSQLLTRELEKDLGEKGINPVDLKENPQIINDILEARCLPLVYELQRTKSSGVFLILDATINPEIEDARFSRAGLYIRNMEPNVVNMETPYFQFLRGSTAIAKENNIKIHSQWDMEFDIRESEFFQLVMETARENPTLHISRLYKWCSKSSLRGTTDEVMLCVAPLIAENGTVFGVCGFEVSEALFRLSYGGEEINASRAFSVLGRVSADQKVTGDSFFSTGMLGMNVEELNINKKSGSLHKFSSGEDYYIGTFEKLFLYPKDSPFFEEEWISAVVMPEKEYEIHIYENTTKILVISFVGILISIVGAFFVSRRYLKPIIETFGKMKDQDVAEIQRTNIAEIDDLLEYLSKQDRKRKKTEIYGSELFAEFIQNIDTLSPAEKSVFDLYMEGYTAQEITEKLFLSINTIKTHNRRIYEKLNVSSRKELMVYIGMMEEKGMIKKRNDYKKEEE